MVCCAKVLCLILVATATNVYAEPSPSSAQKLLDSALVSSQNYIVYNYDLLAQISEESMTIVKSTFSQLNAQENITELFGCYKNYKKSYEDKRQNLVTLFGAYVHHLDESRNEVKNCPPLYANDLSGNIKALECMKKIWRRSLDIVERATATFQAAYDEMEEKIEACSDFFSPPAMTELMEYRSPYKK